MSSFYRQNSMMAMLDAKPEEKTNGTEYRNSSTEHLSPVRKHLINTYLQIQDEEAMPLLGEYFGVALSFVALGALVRSSNSSAARKNKRLSEEERLDLRACSRLERIAVESMLKEAMERLRGLAMNAYQMEEKMRDMIAEDIELDKERVQLLSSLADAESVIQDLKALRRAEGRANERVMCIVASKEQEWLKEKKSLQKEIEKLKENLSVMTREAKLQARRCRNSNCEHCKGIDRVVRNVKGRISLRELNFRSPQVFPKREIQRVDQRLEDEEDTCLMKSTVRKGPSEQNKMERQESSTSSRTLFSATTGEAGQSGATELLVKQQQDMESELANILKRVGMLKQRSFGGSATVTRKEDLLEGKNSSAAKDLEVTDFSKDEVVVTADQVEEKIEELDDAISSEPIAHDYMLESGDYSSDQEDYFSVGDEEESNLVELDKAFELKDDSDLPGLDQTNVSLEDIQKVEEDSKPESVYANVALIESLNSESFGFAKRLAELKSRKDLIGSDDFDLGFSECSFPVEQKDSSVELKDSADGAMHTEDSVPVLSDILLQGFQCPEISKRESHPVLLENSKTDPLEDAIPVNENDSPDVTEPKLGDPMAFALGHVATSSTMVETSSSTEVETWSSTEVETLSSTEVETSSSTELETSSSTELETLSSTEVETADSVLDCPDGNVQFQNGVLNGPTELPRISNDSDGTDFEHCNDAPLGAGPEEMDEDARSGEDVLVEEQLVKCAQDADHKICGSLDEHQQKFEIEIVAKHNAQLGHNLKQCHLLEEFQYATERKDERMQSLEIVVEQDVEECHEGERTEEHDEVGFDAKKSIEQCHERSGSTDEPQLALDIHASEGEEHFHKASGSECENEYDQVLGVVAEDDGSKFPYALSVALDASASMGSENVGSSLDLGVSDLHKQDRNEYESGLDVQENLNFKPLLASSEGGLVENQDIPLFERNNVDDFAGELPELEEKRVCSSEIADHNLTVCNEQVSRQNENLKDLNLTVCIEEVSSQTENLKDLISVVRVPAVENVFGDDDLDRDGKQMTEEVQGRCQSGIHTCISTILYQSKLGDD